MEKHLADPLAEIVANIEGSPSVDRFQMLATAAEQFILGTDSRLTPVEASPDPVDLQRHRKFWRAMGFAPLADGERKIVPEDIRQLAKAEALIEAGIASEEIALQMTRVMGLSAARVASAQVDVIRSRMRELGGDEMMAANALLNIRDGLLADLEGFFGWLWKRHLTAAIQRALMADAASDPGMTGISILSAGFCDIAGFTALSRRVTGNELASAVARFESQSHDIVTSLGGRVVKLIGDEIFFVVDGENAPNAVQIGLELADKFEADRDIGSVRVGIASGKALAHEGDVFGESVNLAARLVSHAFRGTVLVDEATAHSVARIETFVVKQIRETKFKGIGGIKPYVVRYARTND